VLRSDYPGQICSIAKALEVIGERWSLLIVRDVMNGRRRFDELQKGLGIARNVLSARLQRLVDENILERRPYQTSPERYEYFLTEKGLDLWPSLLARAERTADADRAQGVRRSGQRPRHLRELRPSAARPRCPRHARPRRRGASVGRTGERLGGRDGDGG
jgi:DNA-binding HxlR family transcriptional regulator